MRRSFYPTLAAKGAARMGHPDSPCAIETAGPSASFPCLQAGNYGRDDKSRDDINRAQASLIAAREHLGEMNGAPVGELRDLLAAAEAICNNDCFFFGALDGGH